MLTPGSTVGGLVIGDLLGRGAMGEVYRAEQLSLKRPVAVKRIAEHLIDEETVVTRFEREAQCIARVNSPHVLGVYEFGRFHDESGNGHWLLVMELVEGGCNARDLLRRGMDWRQATSIVMQVAEGLASAAEHGIVHRDIKPDNIMVNNKGVAKLADFGLAKAADSHGMTMEGALVGTPYYMPPEACRGDPIDHQGDLYSLGATWYHLLSGRPVFQDRNTMMLLRAHAEIDPEPLSRVAPAVPKAIATIVHQCLAKRASERPASAEHLVHLLQTLVAEGIHVPRTVPELLSESGSKEDQAFASTMKTAIAATTTPRPDPEARTIPQSGGGQWSTVAGELAAAPSLKKVPPLKGRSLPWRLPLVIVVVAGLSAGAWFSRGVWLDRSPPSVAADDGEPVAEISDNSDLTIDATLTDPADPADPADPVDPASLVDRVDPVDPVDPPDPAPSDQFDADAESVVEPGLPPTSDPLSVPENGITEVQPTLANTQQRAEAIDLGLQQADEELERGRILDGWSWLERMPRPADQDTARLQRWNALRDAAIQRARQASGESLEQSMAMIEGGQLREALAQLRADRPLAHIAGAGERYDEVIKRLEKALASTNGD